MTVVEARRLGTRARHSAQNLLSLARRRVFVRLERAAGFPILVVSAPAGYGKTTVLREFLTAKNRPYRCLDLASSGADLLGFMRAFANCLGDLAPALLTSFMGVHDDMCGSQVAPTAIAGWAAGHLDSVDVTLMIDGIEIATDERILRLLNELIDRTAEMRIRWILVAQTPDRFPIARWLANDRLDIPLDDTDLALTFEDLTAAVVRTRAPIARNALHDLCRTTCNWPATIALALGDIAGLAALPGDVPAHPYAAFAERALAARSEAERRFLTETCLYGHFDDALLFAAGWRNNEAMLDRLCAAGALLFRQEPGSYRYHELFRSFLEQRLRASPPELYRRCACAAATVCRRIGRPSDALALYTDLENAQPLAALLGEHGFELIDRGEADAVSRGIAALSDGDFAAFPAALAVKANLESLHGSFDLAEAWFRQAIDLARDEGERARIVFRFATDLVRADRSDAIDILEPVVAQGGHDIALAVSLAGLLATACATHQQTAKAALTIERALEQLIDVQDPAVRAKLYFQAGYVACFARDPARAKAYAQTAVEIALAAHHYDIAARALSILYNVAMDYEDDVRAALSYLDELASCSIKAGNRHLLVYATLAQFEIEVFRGNVVASARLDDQLKSLEVDYSVFASEMLLPAQALRATWSGDFHRAYRLMAPTAESQITPARRAQRYAQIAVYAAAAGLRAEAAGALRRALTITSRPEAPDTFTVFTQAYIALAHSLLGRHRRAARMLLQLAEAVLTTRLEALTLAVRAINDRRTLGRYSTDLCDVLARLDACDFGGIGRFIEALPLPETFGGEWGQLSGREREVLVHLSAGLEATEIAALSGRSSETVGALTRTVCRKLGSEDPRDAVALAKSAGMLRICPVDVR